MIHQNKITISTASQRRRWPAVNNLILSYILHLIYLKLIIKYEKVVSKFQKWNHLFKLNYLYILSLPSGFKYNNIYVLLFIVVLTVNSILFTSGFLDNIILSSPLHIILIVLVVLYLLFIMFNLYIRLYNVLFRALSYHICKKYDPKSNFLRLCTYYYLYNIMCFLLSLILINRILTSLQLYNYNLYQYLLPLTIISCILIVTIYLDIKYNTDNLYNDFNIKNIHYSKISILIQYIFAVLSFSFSLSCISSCLNNIVLGDYLFNMTASNKFNVNYFLLGTPTNLPDAAASVSEGHSASASTLDESDTISESDSDSTISDSTVIPRTPKPLLNSPRPSYYLYSQRYSDLLSYRLILADNLLSLFKDKAEYISGTKSLEQFEHIQFECDNSYYYLDRKIDFLKNYINNINYTYNWNCELNYLLECHRVDAELLFDYYNKLIGYIETAKKSGNNLYTLEEYYINLLGPNFNKNIYSAFNNQFLHILFYFYKNNIECHSLFIDHNLAEVIINDNILIDILNRFKQNLNYFLENKNILISILNKSVSNDKMLAFFSINRQLSSLMNASIKLNDNCSNANMILFNKNMSKEILQAVDAVSDENTDITAAATAAATAGQSTDLVVDSSGDWLIF